MASTDGLDPLLLLRQSIASGGAIIPSTSADSPTEASLAQATHLFFTQPVRVAIPIDVPTRFVSSNDEKPVDLRSIYFAWLNREVAIPEYNASATKLNDELAAAAAAGGGGGGGGGKGEVVASTVHKFAFVERLDLITWLEGASEESEYIKPLAGSFAAATAGGGGGGAGGVAAALAAGSSSKVAPATGSASAGAMAASARAGAAGAGRGTLTLDPRLAQIYNGERRMGDRNTVLRGIKATDFSHVRKHAQQFMAKKPGAATGGGGSSSSIANNPALALNQKPQRRPDPIILLSPSASSLLRMSNVKSFLETGRYTPPDHNSTASMLHISRIMKDIDPSRPMRFILVEGPEQFKPEYWNRVVAVFTTGQAWQFKNYRWSNPSELFKHVLGVYLGWRGDQPPEAVRSYGHGVMACTVEKWRDPGQPGAETSRWRDREVVENIWKAIEGNMRAKGWRKDAAPTSI